MVRFRLPIALLAVVVGAVLSNAAASAAPATPSTLTYEFENCTGPAPTEFDAVKQPGEGAALHLADGSIFIAIAAVDVETGDVLFTTPGFDRNALTTNTVTCSVLNPRNDREQVVTGLIVPVG
jgi:hypothetical protein